MVPFRRQSSQLGKRPERYDTSVVADLLYTMKDNKNRKNATPCEALLIEVRMHEEKRCPSDLLIVV